MSVYTVNSGFQYFSVDLDIFIHSDPLSLTSYCIYCTVYLLSLCILCSSSFVDNSK